MPCMASCSIPRLPSPLWSLTLNYKLGKRTFSFRNEVLFNLHCSSGWNFLSSDTFSIRCCKTFIIRNGLFGKISWCALLGKTFTCQSNLCRQVIELSKISVLHLCLFMTNSVKLDNSVNFWTSRTHSLIIPKSKGRMQKCFRHRTLKVTELTGEKQRQDKANKINFLSSSEFQVSQIWCFVFGYFLPPRMETASF